MRHCESMTRFNTVLAALAALLLLGAGVLLAARLAGTGTGSAPDLSPVEIVPSPAATSTADPSAEATEPPTDGADTAPAEDRPEDRFQPAPPKLYELDDDDTDGTDDADTDGDSDSEDGDSDDDDDGDDDDDD